MHVRGATSCTWVATPIHRPSSAPTSIALRVTTALTAPHRLNAARLSKRRRRHSLVLHACSSSSSSSPPPRGESGSQGQQGDGGGEPLHHIIRDLGSLPQVDDEDRASMQNITDKGADAVGEIGDQLRIGLEDLQAESKRLADELVEKETEALLQRYNERKEELLNDVDDDRRVIQTEMGRVKDLATSLKRNDGAKSDGRSPAGRVLLATTALFAVATLYYAVVGITASDGASVTNAVIDLVFAMASAYFLSRQNTDADADADADADR